MKAKGGKDTHEITINVLKALLSNCVARNYSLHGKKKKKVFKNLLLCKLVVDVVRAHKPDATEAVVLKFVATWLSQSTLRYNREQ